MIVLLPPALRKGDEIRIISPSSEINSFPRRLKRGMLELQKAGYRPTLGHNALKKAGYEAGTPRERVNDLEEAFRDKNVKAIMASTGGYTSNRILDLVDFNLIKQNPKILIGFSDITALLLGIFAKTNLVTFHGPGLLPSFGDANGVHADSLQAMKTVLEGRSEKIVCTDFETFSEQSLFWDKEDDIPRSYERSKGVEVLSDGIVSGTLLGGNLETLIGIAGSPFMPDFDGAILFLEECGSTTAKTLRDLKTLEYLGVLPKVRGMVFGRQFNYRDNPLPYDLQSELKKIGKKFRFPILYNMPIGHTEPKLTLPLGIKAVLNSKEKTLVVERAVLKGG